MKNKRIIIGIIFCVLIGLFIWWPSKRQPIISMPESPGKPASKKTHALTAATSNSTHSNKDQTLIIEGVPISDEDMRYYEHRKADPLYDWKQPINFYGKVVDESNNPVNEATVNYQWSTLSEKGTLKSKTRTDYSGLFSIHETGKRIFITPSKTGYYTSRRDWDSYEYANPADGLFTPDSNNPIIFHLRKKEPGVNLITSQHGISPDFKIHVERDGTPVNIDLIQGKAGNSGQMLVSEFKPDESSWKKAISWSFRMEIPDGGFIEQNDEYPFLAPDSGYQPVAQFDFQQGQTNWATRLDKSFYIKFGSPPRYGWLRVKTGISYAGAILTYAINPDGSQNLEPQSQ